MALETPSAIIAQIQERLSVCFAASPLWGAVAQYCATQPGPASLKPGDHGYVPRFVHFCAMLSIAGLIGDTYRQLPDSGTLSEHEERSLRSELGRLEQLGKTAADKEIIKYILARTWAAGQQWPEAVEWLGRLDVTSGIDPSKDRAFAALSGTREFEAVVNATRRAATPVSNSRLAFQVPEGDLVPESVAYDPGGKTFYFGSMRKGKIVRCSARGTCSDFVTGLGAVLGLKSDGTRLWVLSNSEQDAALITYELTTGRMAAKQVLGPGHLLNDLVITRGGEVLLTDTRAGAVWRLAPNGNRLKKLPGRFDAANGITIAPNGRRLYVSSFPDGVTVFDLRTQTGRALKRPAGLCLANVDGLYFHRGHLIAIQNGIMTPRIIRILLTRDGMAAARFEILERANPLFDGVTTGVVVGDTFYYMANVQDDRTRAFKPISILSLGL